MRQYHIDVQRISRVPHRRTKNMPHSLQWDKTIYFGFKCPTSVRFCFFSPVDDFVNIPSYWALRCGSVEGGPAEPSLCGTLHVPPLVAVGGQTSDQRGVAEVPERKGTRLILLSPCLYPVSPTFPTDTLLLYTHP